MGVLRHHRAGPLGKSSAVIPQTGALRVHRFGRKPLSRDFVQGCGLVYWSLGELRYHGRKKHRAVCEARLLAATVCGR